MREIGRPGRLRCLDEKNRARASTLGISRESVHAEAYGAP